MSKGECSLKSQAELALIPGVDKLSMNKIKTFKKGFLILKNNDISMNCINSVIHLKYL